MVIPSTIRKLRFATRSHLMSIHDMGRKSIMGNLKPYVSKTMQGKEYI
ncbi:hypothetical protein COJ27_23165 [Bacillus cereus]|nr:hypothetical protein COJ27_23165 [Bacillus cereus]